MVTVLPRTIAPVMLVGLVLIVTPLSVQVHAKMEVLAQIQIPAPAQLSGLDPFVLIVSF